MQEAMQKFGRFLSAMVMPNIGAFIAWGFITALFIPAGWIPNRISRTNGEMVAPVVNRLYGRRSCQRSQRRRRWRDCYCRYYRRY